MKFSDFWEWTVDKVHRLESFCARFARQALDAGAHDLVIDAATIAKQVAADPTILSSADKREAAISALEKRAEAQGLTLGEHTIAAMATVALANETAPAKVELPSDVEPADGA